MMGKAVHGKVRFEKNEDKALKVRVATLLI